MDSKAEFAAAYNVVYEDIEPFFEWHTDDDFHVLVVMLPGFRRDQLKVQVTSAPILKISAQRQIGGNRWRRVYKEFSLPSDCDPNDITAKFEAGTLKIKFSKLKTPSAKSPERDNGDAEKNGEDQAKPTSDGDQVSDESPEEDLESAASGDDLTKETGKTDGGVSEKDAVHQEDQEKAKSGDEEDSGKTNKKEKEPAAASDDFTKEKGKIKNGVDGEKKAVHQEDQAKAKSADEVSGKIPAAKQKEKEPPAAAEAVTEAPDGKQRTKKFSRFQTHLLDFTLSLRPPLPADEQKDSYKYREALGDFVARLKKMKYLMNLLVVLLVVAFVLYLKNALKPSLEGSEEEQEL
ncbi:inactive protein RESTRICTED TEV MOVEMENT 2-like [Neltuma alba]|uniref:inactive protein RESTRICTED TEV MOVEMENT 2-like n=1 Tax=Neltuma alba TaxID=207710 RepID=UPI0010A2E43B|nr:inactive protein RESTRICTED TEV MOVEMENT 2-like [Prosopis alba]XP_028758017.1 inactive protein RESTRICTED TEV MOVEMENT 2-like [Prosopis alba]